jgi:hypothetical protein
MWCPRARGVTRATHNLQVALLILELEGNIVARASIAIGVDGDIWAVAQLLILLFTVVEGIQLLIIALGKLRALIHWTISCVGRYRSVYVLSPNGHSGTFFVCPFRRGVSNYVLEGQLYRSNWHRNRIFEATHRRPPGVT